MLGNHGLFRIGQTSGAVVLPTPILDDLSITATGAYSLRKMRAAYAGNCIRVRRSSDNAEQNIGFVNDALDTASLLTFVGAGNGFVTTWYDQSSNGLNATQTVAGSQPRIVTSGTVTLSNSRPAVQFTSSFLNFSGFTPGDYSAFVVNERTSASHVIIPFANSGALLPFALAQNADGNLYMSNGATYAFAAGAGTGQVVLAGFNLSGTYSAFQNGVAKSFSYLGGGLANTFNSIGNTSGTVSTGFISELIFVSSDSTAKRAGVEANFRAYYNTY